MSVSHDIGREGSSAEAFAVFYRRYERLVVGWLVRRTGRADVAADLAAEVFAAAYLGASRFRAGPEPAGAWLLGIARHKLLRSLRRERTEASARARLGVDRVEVSDEALAAVDELRDCGVLGLLEMLPEDQREAVRGRVVDEADYSELALRLEISPLAARKRVSRGLAALRRGLQHEGDTA
jgi:RNA polymerase sigma factor (sigma-70 family)